MSYGVKPFHVTQINACKDGISCVCCMEVGTIEVGITEVDVGKVGVAEVSSFKIGITEVCPFKVGMMKVGTPEVGTVEVGTIEINIFKIRAFKVGISEIGYQTMCFPPLVPRHYPLFENSHMLRVCHKLLPSICAGHVATARMIADMPLDLSNS
jgi:hypothetical protein